jgi:hypothetical protein
VYHLLKNHVKLKSNEASKSLNLEHLLSQPKLDSNARHHLIVTEQESSDHHVVKLDSKKSFSKQNDKENDFSGYHVLVVKKLIKANQASDVLQLDENHTVKKIDNHHQNGFINDQQLVRKSDALIHHVIKKKKT